MYESANMFVLACDGHFVISHLQSEWFIDGMIDLLRLMKTNSM